MRLLYGSQNFGYSISTSDKDWFEFVYPTWDNILNSTIPDTEYKNADGSITKVKDIRSLYKMILKSNFNDLQFMYSKEMHDCRDLEWFFKNRDRLVRFNLKQSFIANKGFILSCISEGSRVSMVKALCSLELLKRLLDLDCEFDLHVNGLYEYRLDESKSISKYDILCELDRLELMLDNTIVTVDEEIISEMKQHIKYLLKEHLNNTF